MMEWIFLFLVKTQDNISNLTIYSLGRYNTEIECQTAIKNLKNELTGFCVQIPLKRRK